MAHFTRFGLPLCLLSWPPVITTVTCQPALTQANQHTVHSERGAPAAGSGHVGGRACVLSGVTRLSEGYVQSPRVEDAQAQRLHNQLAASVPGDVRSRQAVGLAGQGDGLVHGSGVLQWLSADDRRHWQRQSPSPLLAARLPRTPGGAAAAQWSETSPPANLEEPHSASLGHETH